MTSRDLLRLLAIFSLTVLAMAGAYSLGFASALNAERSEALVALRSAMAPLALRGEGAGMGAGGAAAGAGDTPRAGEAPDGDAFALFWEALRHLRDEHAGEAPAQEDLTYGAIRGSLKSLEDPYTTFFDPVLTEVNRPTLDSAFEGIGAYVTSDEQGQLVIQTPMRGQPAEKAGVRAGDIVIRVDGEDISGLDLNEAVLKIRGPKGTTVELTILREGVDGEIVIPVVRDKIDVPSVNDVRLLEDEGAPELGYLQLTSFAMDTGDELVRAIDELRAEGAQALVLDLRNNPGGYLETAIQVASEFIDEGMIVQQEDSRGQRKVEQARRGGHATDLPLVLLVNRGSASASEIVAGAIRDHERGVIVGETTFGKGSVQNVHELSDGSQLRVTVAVWLTPDGNHIHKKGIEPDVLVEPDEPDEPPSATTPNAADGTGAPEGAEAAVAPDAADATDAQLERAIIEARRLLERSATSGGGG